MLLLFAQGVTQGLLWDLKIYEGAAVTIPIPYHAAELTIQVLCIGQRAAHPHSTSSVL